jgi:Calcineurin-like phosphoesterase/Purple acid Phosphatase, N-terminal domain
MLIALNLTIIRVRRRAYHMMKSIFPVVAGISLVLSGCNGSNNNNNDDGGEPVAPPVAATCSGTTVQSQRLFLQQLGADSVIIKWRGNLDGGAQATSVCFGTDMASLPESSKTDAVVTATGHSEALLSGLQPDTTYYYSVGGAGTADQAHHFRTAPTVGQLPQDGNTRIWIVGDSGVGGTGKPEAGYVRDGFMTFAKNNRDEPADLFLMLGDNAYDQGTDNEHQLAVFDVYTALLATTPVWPTIGNHEMGSVGVSTATSPNDYTVLGSGASGGPDPAPDSPMPYLNIFTLPTTGEVGGLASGTEQYYSFDYANVHIVSLDSQLAIRDTDSRAAMLQWFKNDLMANSQDWTIVIFHHPPYTKGSHDSDSELGGIDQPIFAIREEFTPVFEQYGVDLAYSGHSHIYERSKYINGNTGLSDTFNNMTMAELNAMNEPASGQGDEAYTQISRGSGIDDKVVYTVAGNGGKITYTTPGFPHPAHFFSQLALGSVVIDIDASRLEASFVDVNGAVLDSFVMTR